MSDVSVWLNYLVAVSHIAASIAVVITLIFIAVQIRESRRIAAGNSYQTLLQAVNMFYNSLVENEDLGLL